jgi:hypothetical protein
MSVEFQSDAVMEGEVAEPPVAPAKPKREGVKMTDKQKDQLKKHMAKMEKQGMSKSEMKSHRMKMMGRMRKGMSVAKAHKDITK